MQEGTFEQYANIWYVTWLAKNDTFIYTSSAPSVMKPCSHVTCNTCTDTLVRPANQCVVCDKLLAEGDVLELKREGESPLPNVYPLFSVFPQAQAMRVVGWPRLGNKELLFRDKLNALIPSLISLSNRVFTIIWSYLLSEL